VPATACIVTSHGEAEFWEANSSGRNQRGLAAVDKTPLRRRHDHRIFARHLIGEGGHAEALLHPEKNIEIGQGGFTITMPTPSAISSAIRAEPRYLAGSI
jgi:hypothetical protein